MHAMSTTTIRTLIAKLGGQKEVARALSLATRSKVGTTTIAQWAIRGSIPWRWRLLISQMAELKKVELSKAEERLLAFDEIKAEQISAA